MILILTYDVRRPGGIERLSLQIFEQLQLLGFQPRLLATRHIGPGAFGRYIGRFWFFLKLLWWLPRAKRVISMHALLLMPLDLCTLFPGLYSKPIYCWLHGVEVFGEALTRSSSRLRRCTGLLASSNFTADQVALGISCCPPISVVNPCSDLSYVSIPEPSLPLRMLTVSRLDARERYKGHDQIIEALQLLKRQRRLDSQLRWIVVGDGDYLSSLQMKAFRAGVSEHIEWKGCLSDAEVAHQFMSCSVFIMPSEFSVDASGRATGEGFGIAYLEAAMAGRASVAALRGGHQDLIVNEETGWLVPADPYSLSEIIYTLSTDAESLRLSGENALARARSSFSLEAQRTKLVEVFG